MSTQPFISTYTAEEVHKSDIYAIATSSKYTYAGSGDGTISLWSNQQVSMDLSCLNLEEIQSGIHHISCGITGEYLVGIAFDGSIHSFNLKTQSECPLNSAKQVKGAWAVSVYQHFALVSTLYGNIYLFDLKEDKIVLELAEPSGFKQPCLSVDVTSDGSLAVAGYENGKVRVFNLETKRVAYTLASHIAPPRRVRFSLDGQQIAVAGEESIGLFTLNGGSYLGSLNDHEACVYDVAFDPTSTKLLSVSGDGTTKLWSLETRTCVLTLHDTDSPLFSCAWCEPRANIIGGAPSGFVTGGVDGTLRWYREASGNNNDI